LVFVVDRKSGEGNAAAEQEALEALEAGDVGGTA
jgi:hypothetical protein